MTSTTPQCSSYSAAYPETEEPCQLTKRFVCLFHWEVNIVVKLP